ncbi:MAG: hypothetical protein OXG24_03935, partial [Gammaproteobacteria bacterium]|nr:hypothetical protein [Gammaproteobacteria bacterium]
MSEHSDLSQIAGLDNEVLQPLTGSRKIYVDTDQDFRVAMREILVSPTPSIGTSAESVSRLERNPSVRVYDT